MESSQRMDESSVSCTYITENTLALSIIELHHTVNMEDLSANLKESVNTISKRGAYEIAV